MTEQKPEHRDFVGYGRFPPNPAWPDGARLALVIVLNVEEGAEDSIVDGDDASETALTDAIAGEVPRGKRDLVAESLWEYGSRVGFWRLYELFAARGTAVTVNACGRALERNPEAAAAIGEAGFDLCCHGYRFARHYLMGEGDERRLESRVVTTVRELEIRTAPIDDIANPERRFLDREHLGHRRAVQHVVRLPRVGPL